MTRRNKRLTDIFSEQTVEWLQLILFVSIFPTAIWMYLHYQSMKRRYPGAVNLAMGGMPAVVAGGGGGSGPGGAGPEVEGKEKTS